MTMKVRSSNRVACAPLENVINLPMICSGWTLLTILLLPFCRGAVYMHGITGVTRLCFGCGSRSGSGSRCVRYSRYVHKYAFKPDLLRDTESRNQAETINNNINVACFRSHSSLLIKVDCLAGAHLEGGFTGCFGQRRLRSNDQGVVYSTRWNKNARVNVLCA